MLNERKIFLKPVEIYQKSHDFHQVQSKNVVFK